MYAGGLLCIGFGLVALACRSHQAPPLAGAGGSEPEPRQLQVILPLSAPALPAPELVSLGRQLFFSPVLAADGRVSCASCHLPEHAFADPRPLSGGPVRPDTLFNTPSIYNVALLDVFGWAGKESSLEAQLDGLIENPSIMGTTWAAIFARLTVDPAWQERLARAFPDGATPESARSALLAYERSLVSVGAAFDRWQLGDEQALSAEARTGYELFLSRGCASCHQGRLLGGNLFERLGVLRDYFGDGGADRERDLGRFRLTGREEDRNVFRVPSLRNVALTAPYLHDGSQPTLAGTVSMMATYQLGRELAPEQIRAIVTFLEALSTGASEAGTRPDNTQADRP